MAQTDTREPGLHTVSVTVNGTRHSREVEPRQLLVYFLREQLGLTGTHVGCDTSQCGACTILLDGVAVKSCTILAVQVDGADIKTIEGYAEPNGKLHPIQQAFWEEHGLQCGFCTPGMVIAIDQLLRDNPSPTEAQVRRGIDGNLCRCTGYQNIVKSALSAGRKISGEEPFEKPEAADPAAGDGWGALEGRAHVPSEVRLRRAEQPRRGREAARRIPKPSSWLAATACCRLMKLRLAQPKLLVDIGRIPGLSYIRSENGALAIGAMTTYREILHVRRGEAASTRTGRGGARGRRSAGAGQRHPGWRDWRTRTPPATCQRSCSRSARR